MIFIGRLLGLVLFLAGIAVIAWPFANLDPASPAFRDMLGSDELRQAVDFVLLHGETMLIAGIALGVGVMLLLLAQLVKENT
ncbi:hypothetical protein [Frigidibacter sp. ROC022]|uniref:hypothetical protein n=1 Tax=Frigidibacter sp. ROC022 TaxID=2971796 RepID=UPI00215B2036|nr:hypothetical protein [Frigidibacter sp. ROC022]MCR8724842.1 hypothetical protein [Frigidibacter sp. ROC022]